jgi:hypothetical protein
MTKRVTPATTTAIGVITVALLAAGGSRLLMTTHVAAATTGTVTVAPATLPPDGKALAIVTFSGGQPCAGSLLSSTFGTVQSDGASQFSAAQTGPWTPTLKVSLNGSGTGQAYVQATTSPGLQNLSAVFSGGFILGGGSCSGQTPNAQLTEVGTPASVVLDAPTPARLMVSTPTTTAAVTAHVVDASNFPVPGEKVVLVRSGDGSQIPMTDAGSGTYTANVAPASGPRSETLIAVDTTANPNLQSGPQTLLSASSNADCRHLGLRFTPGTITADGQSASTASATFFNGPQPAANEPVVFTGDPGLNISTTGSATDPGGVASAMVHSGYSIGNKKVTVTAPNSLISCSQTLTIGNGNPGTKDSGQISRYIYRAYNDVLHRKGEDAGVEYYGNFINFGGSRGQVALAFTTTTEYLTNTVNGMYQKYLGRPGETDGVNYWVGQLENGGTTDEQLAALFLSSDEFYAQHGGTDSGFIDGLYQAVLGRGPDAAGKNSWMAAMHNGWTRTQVAYFFTGSNEQLSQKVVGYYSTFLNRGPSSVDDVNYWVNAIQHGVHDENVMAAFIGSQEYFDQS